MYNQENTIYDLNLRTINIVCGFQGVGKTIFLTAVAYLYATDRQKINAHSNYVKFMINNNYKLDNDNIVVANYNLELRKRGRKKIIVEKEKNIKKILTFKKHISANTLIICDEAQDVFNAREWQKTEREASKFCEFARHFALNIVFSCQDFESIDKTFRGYSKIYYIDETKVYNVYGKCAKKNEFFKMVDIDYIEIYYYEFENGEKYEKFKKNKSIFDVINRKKITIYENLYAMYNHNYLQKIFLEKRR